MEVHQIPFVWDLSMSVKLDARSTVIGSYERDDLSSFMWPEEKKKHKRRVKRRRLDYELVWNITEMQVKTFVRAIFPKPQGPLTMQLTKEEPLGPQELTYGESRSQGLVKDIQVSAREAAHAALPRQFAESCGRDHAVEINHENPGLNDTLGSRGRQFSNDSTQGHPQPPSNISQLENRAQVARPMAPMFSVFQRPAPAGRTMETLKSPGITQSALHTSPGLVDEPVKVSIVPIAHDCIAK